MISTGNAGVQPGNDHNGSQAMMLQTTASNPTHMTGHQPMQTGNNNGTNSSSMNRLISTTGSSSDQKNFLAILNHPEFSDITLMVEGKPIYCHQVILASRSNYFEATFSHDFSEKE